jgi:flagellar hook-length control protein FliK
VRAEVTIYPASLVVKTRCEGETANSPTNSEFDGILSESIRDLKGTSNPRVELALMQLINMLFTNEFVNGKMNLEEISEATLPYCTSAIPIDCLSERLPNNDFLNTARRQLVLQFNEKGELEQSTVEKIMDILSSYLPSADSNVVEKFQKKLVDLIESHVIFPDKNDGVAKDVKDTIQLPNFERSITRATDNLDLKDVDILNGKNNERSEGGKIRFLPENESAIKPRQIVEKSSIFNAYTKNENNVIEWLSTDFTRTFAPTSAEMTQKVSEGFATVAEGTAFKQHITQSNAELFDHIVERVVVALKSKNEQISVKLKPDYLGQVFIRVTTGKTGMKAELFIENTRLSEAMKNCIPELKTQIQQQGYSLKEVDVHTLSDGNQMNFLNHQFNDGNGYEPKKQVSFPRVSQKHSEEIADQYYFGWQDDSSINFMV